MYLLRMYVEACAVKPVLSLFVCVCECVCVCVCVPCEFLARLQELCLHGSQCLLSAQASLLCQVGVTTHPTCLIKEGVVCL